MTTSPTKTQTQDLREETLYSFKRIGTAIVIQKWAGEELPSDQMTLTNLGRGTCNCLGSIRNPQCKHKKMWAKLQGLHIPLMGAFYDYDHDILYTPEDGEGVPLRGAVDIWGLSIQQNKEY